MWGDEISSNRNAPSFLSISVVRAILFWFSAILAGTTLLTHISQFVGLTFKTYAIVGTLFCAITSGFVLWISWKQIRRVNHPDSTALILILSIGLLGAVLALVSHNPDADDYNYVPNAVYYLQNPDEPMGFAMHALDCGDQTFTAYFLATASAYDYERAVLAYLLGVEYLFVYYILSVALVGFLIPLALFCLLAHFSEDTMNMAIGVAITIGILLLLGETHRTFGNFSFNRAFQGKTVLFTVGIPFFAAATLSFFNNRSVYFWMLLFTTAIAMTGTTSTTLILFPSLAVVLTIAFIAVSQNEKQSRLWIRRSVNLSWPDIKEAFLFVLAYFTSLTYTVIYGLVLLIMTAVEQGFGGGGSALQVNIAGWPTTFMGHVYFLIDVRKPVTPIILASTTVLSLVFTTDIRRRLLLTWIVALLVLFLNPLVAPLIIRFVTTPNTYWRLFYLYPFPLVAAITATYLVDRIDLFSIRTRAVVYVLVCVVLIGLHFPGFSSSVFQSETYLAWPGYKLPGGDLENAEKIAAVAPDGIMLAPPELSGIIPMLNSGIPQVRPRGLEVRQCWRSRGLWDEGELRMRAAEFVSGDIEYLPDFHGLLKQNRVRSIVFNDAVFENSAVRELLQTYQFPHQQSIDGYVIVWRDE